MKRAIPSITSVQKIVKLMATVTAIGVLVTGCVITPTKPLQKTEGQIKLDAGKSSFQQGEYGMAENALLDEAIWQDDKITQVESLKYLAFIYCVTERVTLCRHSFYKALQLNPSFELTTAERTHPLWGPEFVATQSGFTGK